MDISLIYAKVKEYVLAAYAKVKAWALSLYTKVLSAFGVVTKSKKR